MSEEKNKMCNCGENCSCGCHDGNCSCDGKCNCGENCSCGCHNNNEETEEN